MSAKCLGVETLVAFIEGRIASSSRACVDDHASKCEMCREVLSSLAHNTTPVADQFMTSQAPCDRNLAPGTRVGRYVIDKEIGAGGMGKVFAAHDPELNRMVAVKVLHSYRNFCMQRRLRREAQAMAQLAHPNVVAVYDVGSLGEDMFVAMEYVAGKTLAEWLATPRSQREILNTYRAAGRGLAAAHAAGLVHRDFKPENVLIGNDSRVRIVDFGLARLANSTWSGADKRIGREAHVESGQLQQLTASGALVGTPYYMAPEVHAGQEADARSDQFSFCVAIYIALYGQRPFEGDSLETLFENLRAGRLRGRQLLGVPRYVRTVLRRGLSIEPKDRFASMDELLAALTPRNRPTQVALGLVISFAAIAWLIPQTWATTERTTHMRDGNVKLEVGTRASSLVSAPPVGGSQFIADVPTAHRSILGFGVGNRPSSSVSGMIRTSSENDHVLSKHIDATSNSRTVVISSSRRIGTPDLDALMDPEIVELHGTSVPKAAGESMVRHIGPDSQGLMDPNAIDVAEHRISLYSGTDKGRVQDSNVDPDGLMDPTVSKRKE